MLQLVPQLFMSGRAYDITAGSPTTSTITLSFLYVLGARSYEYSLSTTSAVAGFGAWTALASDKIITGLSSSTQYWIKVRAANGVARGPASPVVTSTTSAGASSTTLNNSDKAGTISLDGTLLIMTGGAGMARSVASYSSGKKYYECNFGTGVNGYDHAVGAANSSAVLTAGPGSPDTNSIAFYNGDVNIYAGGSGRGSTGLTSGGSGDRVGVAIDLDNSRMWVRLNGGNWNNSGANDPATNTGGIDISSVSKPWFVMGYGGAGTVVNTFNFGGSAYTDTAPSGFGNW